jgi:hypothetical protein
MPNISHRYGIVSPLNTHGMWRNAVPFAPPRNHRFSHPTLPFPCIIVKQPTMLDLHIICFIGMSNWNKILYVHGDHTQKPHILALPSFPWSFGHWNFELMIKVNNNQMGNQNQNQPTIVATNVGSSYWVLHKHVHNEWWVVNMLWSLDFINAKIKKHLSSSTQPTTCTITNSTSSTYLGKLVTKMWNVITKRHILVKRFKLKGGAKQFVTFDFIVNLNMPYWHWRLLALRNLGTWTTCPFKVCVLP